MPALSKILLHRLYLFVTPLFTLDNNHSLGKAKRDVDRPAIHLERSNDGKMPRLCQSFHCRQIAKLLCAACMAFACSVPPACLPPPLVYTATGSVIRLLVKLG